MIEQYLIKYCAPTLASIKTASLFSIAYETEAQLDSYIEEYNKDFKRKGIKIVALKKRGRALIYVYRIKKLEKDLSKKHIIEFLKQLNYSFNNVEEAIECLKNRISTSEKFPHEIGLFLGYPYEDVVGFIENKGKNSKCTGEWKVYFDEKEAIKKFKKYERCKQIYWEFWCNGRSVLQLTVAENYS